MSCGSTTNLTTESYVPRSEFFGKPNRLWLNPLAQWIAAANQMYSRRCQRRALLELDDDRLADIGVSRQQAEQEARKLFWQ
jgi:uncharacterized protein YjiS (DUF1127 family)